MNLWNKDGIDSCIESSSFKYTPKRITYAYEVIKRLSFKLNYDECNMAVKGNFKQNSIGFLILKRLISNKKSTPILLLSAVCLLLFGYEFVNIQYIMLAKDAKY